MTIGDCTCSDALEFRRTTTKDVETHDGVTKKPMWRTTFQARIPLKIEVVKEFFPFKIMKAKVEIELSSGSNGKQTIRPNLVPAKLSDIRSNVAIHEVKGKKNTMATHRDVDKALDNMTKYDLLSPFPEVDFEYDKKKGYCPKYSVTFYLAIDGIAKFVGTLIPLVLVCTLNTLHLINDCKHSDEGNEAEKVSELLNFSSMLALTVVFLFGSIYDPVGSNSKSSITDSLYILFIFCALILSAVPESFVSGNFAIRIIGAALFWLSFVFPIYNLGYSYWIMNQKKPKKGVEKLFLKDKSYLARDNFSEEFFIKLEPDENNPKDLKEDAKTEIEKTYKLTDDGNNYIIRYKQDHYNITCSPS